MPSDKGQTVSPSGGSFPQPGHARLGVRRKTLDDLLRRDA
jgi:hypothetical protein